MTTYRVIVDEQFEFDVVLLFVSMNESSDFAFNELHSFPSALDLTLSASSDSLEIMTSEIKIY
jgi:hypothetical protein